jgi:hypothetical protein
MHTYGATTSPPSLVQQVWWRDRLDQQHDGVVLMVENFCSRASPTCSREREKWRGRNWLAARVGRERGCALALPYIGGWAANLAPPPRLGRRPKGEEWGASFPPPSRISEPSSTGYGSGCTTHAPRFKSSRMQIWVLIIYLKKLTVGVSPTTFLSKKSFPPPSRRVALGFPLGLVGWAFVGMVRLAQVAKTLPLGPRRAPSSGPTLAPLWNLLEHSGTIPINSETFPESKNCFPLYESYSLDHSGISRDVRDLIRDSEQKLNNQLSILS